MSLPSDEGMVPTELATPAASRAARLAPCTVKSARAQVREWHRHLPELQGGLFAVSVVERDSVFDEMWHCLGVGVAGNPSRVWQNTGRIVITRVATAGAENACSMIYGALARAAKALGYREVWTYTLPDESGTSLRAAGFFDVGMTDGGEWDRPSRARNAAVKPEPKRRWMKRLDCQRRVSTAQVVRRYPEISRLDELLRITMGFNRPGKTYQVKGGPLLGIDGADTWVVLIDGPLEAQAQPSQAPLSEQEI